MNSPLPLILVVDDEMGIVRLIELTLSEQDFRVITATSGQEALEKVEEARPDLVVLDLLLPDIHGLEVMRRIQERRETPIIIVSAKDSDQDKIRGLRLGAADYLTKPFAPDELAARVRAVLRRIGSASGHHVLRAGKMEIDLDRRLVKKNNDLVYLTRTEWMIIQHLALNAGKVMLASELLTNVWGSEYRDDLQYLRVWINRLRSKIEDNPRKPKIIKTLTGIGYILNVDSPDE